MKTRTRNNFLSPLIVILAMVATSVASAEPDLKSTVIYTLTNDPVANENAVAEFRQHKDGSLVPLEDSPFLTSGGGWKTKFQLPHFGPFDLDQAITLSADKTRLFAVNGGSDSIAVFDINKDGSLHAVPGSPFPSGEKTR